MIYFVQATDGGPIKIGTTIQLSKRLKALCAETNTCLRVLAVTEGSYEKEESFHQQFAHLRTVGEWFEPGDDLLGFIIESGRPWDGTDDGPRLGQARLELPSGEMDRVRKAARSIGLSLSAFIRQSVLEKTVDVERRMKP